MAFAGNDFIKQMEDELRANGTYTQVSANVNGTGCKWNLVDAYRQIQPLQKRYAFNGRLSMRLSDNIESYITGSYSSNEVDIKNAPRGVQNTQPFGAAPALSALQITLPVWICPPTPRPTGWSRPPGRPWPGLRTATAAGTCCPTPVTTPSVTPRPPAPSLSMCRRPQRSPRSIRRRLPSDWRSCAPRPNARPLRQQYLFLNLPHRCLSLRRPGRC